MFRYKPVFLLSSANMCWLKFKNVYYCLIYHHVKFFFLQETEYLQCFTPQLFPGSQYLVFNMFLNENK